MRLQYANRFGRDYDALSDQEALRVEEAIRFLATDISYPSLRVKKVQGTKGIWEARVSRSLRLTFELHGHLIILRNIAARDKTLANP